MEICSYFVSSRTNKRHHHHTAQGVVLVVHNDDNVAGRVHSHACRVTETIDWPMPVHMGHIVVIDVIAPREGGKQSRGRPSSCSLVLTRCLLSARCS
jgi:hypothetical protein